MFENQTTFQNLMRNVAECTKLNGYFIGTCYDGKLIFNLLKKKKIGESIELYEGTKKIWEIRKEYEDAAFDDDVTSLGCKINVFQETINKMFPEYLVNFDYLERIMENYGFKLVTRDEAKSLGLPEGSGLFSELFNLLQDDVKRSPFKKNEYGDALEMSPNEKKISFLNRYFAFKKISHVNAEKVAMDLIDETVTERKVSRIPITPAKKPVKKSEKAEKTLEHKKARPLNKKIMLLAATEAIDETPAQELDIVEKPAEVEKKAKKPRAKKVVLAVESETKEQAKENAEDAKEKALEEQQNEKEVVETEGTVIKESETPTPAPKKKAASKKKVTLKLEE